MADRDNLVSKAKLAQQAGKYIEMVDSMKKVAEMNMDLSVEERNLLSVAYENVIGGLQAGGEYKRICNEVIKLIKDHLIMDAASAESKVFYYKMSGDYQRHLAEKAVGGERDVAIEASRNAYTEAVQVAESALSPTNPIRLGLALSYSTFYYEIMSDPDQACSLAKAAFDSAISELDTVSEESYEATTKIMQLLRDNLTLWSGSQ